ncbi:PREDICTED: glucan endo-1,3-beta-glucosidase 11-like isoform X2 [Ipomoea nil]|uniref:glucan endo-1,3-beta-glucosidase 11-like isoform X2 n=1 Tax=Ipomoea nil TaxID=35883 RepID=UPI000900BFE8|nr:PREDICTED: glucan endo-1,3-beta-glucosidase 11-like isoform X2 [Ipomoea nil]
MDTSFRRIAMSALLLLFFTLLTGLLREVECLGINYGQVGNNLPSPEKVLQLLQALTITKARIYDTNPQILNAFANSNVELIVTVENQMLSTLGGDPQQALQWVATHIVPYIPATKVVGIAVGNEIFTDGDPSLIPHLVPAMVNIHAALVREGLDQTIHVSSPHSVAVLASSFPPSAGCFRPDLGETMGQFLQFLAATKSPFWINAYPYFAYKDDPDQISLDYVLFNPNSGTVDPLTKLRYDNMLYAQVDAVIFAISRMGFSGLDVRVSETGWPSKGGADESGATPENAAIYNRNLMGRQAAQEGTPYRPKVGLEAYVFALFNEDMKPGPTSERNYGLFRPDGTMAYNVGIGSSPSSSTSPASAAPVYSSAQAKEMDYQSLVYWMFVYLLAWITCFHHY